MGRLFDDNDTRIGVAILGSTGSIGTQTLDVIARFPEKYKVIGLTARSSTTTMVEQIRIDEGRADRDDKGARDPGRVRAGERL